MDTLQYRLMCEFNILMFWTYSHRVGFARCVVVSSTADVSLAWWASWFCSRQEYRRCSKSVCRAVVVLWPISQGMSNIQHYWSWASIPQVFTLSCKILRKQNRPVICILRMILSLVPRYSSVISQRVNCGITLRSAICRIMYHCILYKSFVFLSLSNQQQNIPHTLLLLTFKTGRPYSLGSSTVNWRSRYG